MLSDSSVAARLLNTIVAAPSSLKVLLVLVADALTLFLSSWLALYIRLGSGSEALSKYWAVCVVITVVGVLALSAFGAYKWVARYFSYNDAWVVARAISIAVLASATLSFILQLSLPRSFIFIQWALAIPLVIAWRVAARTLLRELSPFGYSSKRKNARNVVIYGAGSVGVQLAFSLANTAEMKAVAFVDDNSVLQGRRIGGLQVCSFDDLSKLIEDRSVDDVLLAMSAITPAQKKRLLKKLSEFPVRVRVVPSLNELTDRRVNLEDVRDIDIADLLGRNQVSVNESLLSAYISGKVVMVTGAGGSIGSELCRQILGQQPSAIVLFDLSEFNLYAIERELTALAAEKCDEVQIIPILGSVQDRDHLIQVMRSYSVETLYHAAAYKHVPIVEHNMVSGLRNNVFGTLNTAEASLATGVENFVLISTDKAVRPTNVMGASKRLAEMVLQGLADRDSDTKTRFTIVRFGNVLGSSGSVVPLFQEQIEQGGPVTITHPEITRYFMTIPEAASLVLQAGTMGGSGDVFVLNMGEPVRILDLAKQMIRLAGYTHYNGGVRSDDIDIVYTGLRPGEKLFEELLIGDGVASTTHPMIMSASERHLSWEDVEVVLSQMDVLLRTGGVEKIRDLLVDCVAEYCPQGDIVDLLQWDASKQSAEHSSKILNFKSSNA